MSHYFRTPEMQSGGPFRCYNCNKKLAIKMQGNDYVIQLRCPRCKAFITVKMNEPINHTPIAPSKEPVEKIGA